MGRCSATTASGERCKNACMIDSEMCRVHTTLGECSICMESMTLRTSRNIGCNHRFHSNCLERWKDQGKRTCPVCRKYFDCSRFKVSLSIMDTESMRVLTSNLESNVVNSLIDATNFNFDSVSTDMLFDIDDITELEQLLSDLGTSLSDINTSSTNTEGVTESLII